MHQRSRIFKYVISRHGTKLLPECSHVMPRSSSYLCVQLQGEQIVFWAEHAPWDDSKERRHFMVVPTGHDFTAEQPSYLGTVQCADGFVAHVYEVGKRELLEKGSPCP